jgi:Flp pilus assembly pilin Flp
MTEEHLKKLNDLQIEPIVGNLTVSRNLLTSVRQMHDYILLTKSLKQGFGTIMLTKARKRGQGMMEYLIIVALIAVAGIGIYSAFGKTLRNQTAGMAKEVSGNKADTGLAAASANSAAGRANDPQKEGMSGYAFGNDAK